jgi:hypothetical protein
MELLMLLFPVSVPFAVICGVFCVVHRGQYPFVAKVCIFSLICLLLAYVASLILVCADPHWIDDGVEEFIPWRYRWSWAALYASFLELILFPLWLGGYFLLWVRHTRSTQTDGIHHG